MILRFKIMSVWKDSSLNDIHWLMGIVSKKVKCCEGAFIRRNACEMLKMVCVLHPNCQRINQQPNREAGADRVVAQVTIMSFSCVAAACANNFIWSFVSATTGWLDCDHTARAIHPHMWSLKMMSEQKVVGLPPAAEDETIWQHYLYNQLPSVWVSDAALR